MYRMSVFERLLNDINETLKFAHVELNESCELLMSITSVLSLLLKRTFLSESKTLSSLALFFLLYI